jgi:SAM-dependent methyltransferase
MQSPVSAPRSYLNDGQHYDACHAHRLDDLAFWTNAASKCKSVLELGCGTGRLAIPIAQGGAQTIGIDNNASMLDQARRKSAAGLDVHWVEGDMRSFELGRDDIDLAILAFNSINVLLTLDDALGCLRTTRRHLAPSGRLIIDTFLASPPRLADEELKIDYTLPGGDKITINAKRSYDPSQQLRSLDLVIRSSSDGSAYTDRHDVHVYYPSELLLLAMQAGFDVLAVYGGYDMRRMDARSKRCIVVATPRA